MEEKRMELVQEFIDYLQQQLGEPYLWGGQHTKLTPANYVSLIHKKEDGRGGYKDETYAQAAIDFCKKRFEAGAKVLYAYDCSGLGCYWLYNIKHLYKGDVSANTMMHRCTLKKEAPKRGWWVFHTDSKGKATHVGYMISDSYLIEAKGRKYGVVKTKFRAKDWDRWGIPQVFADELTPPAPEPKERVEVICKALHVRASDSKAGRSLFIAHKGDTFPFVCTAPSGWYEIETDRGRGYISNGKKYTKLL